MNKNIVQVWGDKIVKYGEDRSYLLQQQVNLMQQVNIKVIRI